jgi:multidrug resistance protein, MATE family
MIKKPVITSSNLLSILFHDFGMPETHIHFGMPSLFSLELWYNTILVLLTGYMKNAEIALDALSIW